MKPKNEGQERGQILVLMVIAIIGLLGFAALAIDGGMMYFDRRRAQSAADAASLAGARTAGRFMVDYKIYDKEDFEPIIPGYTAFDNVCDGQYIRGDYIITTVNGTNVTGTDMKDAVKDDAIARAKTDEFNIVPYQDEVPEDHPEDNNGVWVTCSSDGYVNVTVRVTHQTNTSFVHLVFPGLVKNTVYARARVLAQANIAHGQTIVTLDKVECTNSGNDGGLMVDGNSTILIKNGGLWSNSCFDNAGNSLQVHVENGDITYHEGFQGQSYNCPSSDSDPHPITPCPIEVSTKYIERETTKISPPTCGPQQADIAVNGNQNETAWPGTYNSIRMTSSGGSLKMNPGLYCMKGDFKVTSGTLTGDGVTIYVWPNSNASININAGTGNNPNGSPDKNDANVTLRAPSVDPIAGVLIFMDSGNPQGIKIAGNTTSVYQGVIYAPDSPVDIGGTANLASGSTVTFGTQIIADTVKIHGNANLNFDVSGNIPVLSPSYMEQNK